MQIESKYDKFSEFITNQILSVAFAIIVGIIVGFLIFIFGFGLKSATNIRVTHSPYIVAFLPIAGVFIIILYRYFGENVINGMDLVFNSANNEGDIPKRLIPLIMISTWISHMFGGSVGREGVAVQIGSTVANQVSKYINISKILDKRMIISIGIASGFSGLFGTPIAATIFALEVLFINMMSYYAILPTVVAAYVSYYVTIKFGLDHSSFKIFNVPKMTFENMLIVVIASIIFGLVGMMFIYCLNRSKILFSTIIKSKVKRIFYGGILLAALILVFHNSRYSGLGVNIINSIFEEQSSYYYDWILKLMFTVLTISLGFQGGEVTPLFAIGASLGLFLANLFGLPVMFLAALGYVCVFGAATNTLLAPFFIGIEVFGCSIIPYLFVACLMSYVFSGNYSIYNNEKRLCK